MRGSRRLEHLLHARRIGDVSAQSQGTGGRNAIERRLRAGDPNHSPSLGGQKLDHRPAEVTRAEHDRASQG